MKGKEGLATIMKQKETYFLHATDDRFLTHKAVEDGVFSKFPNQSEMFVSISNRKSLQESLEGENQGSQFRNKKKSSNSLLLRLPAERDPYRAIFHYFRRQIRGWGRSDAHFEDIIEMTRSKHDRELFAGFPRHFTYQLDCDLSSSSYIDSYMFVISGCQKIGLDKRKSKVEIVVVSL